MNEQNNEQHINFNNALASLIPGAKPIDEEALRGVKVFGKLMLKRGNKFDETNTSLDQFIASENGDHIKAEMFILGSRNQIISQGKRVFLNVQKEGIQVIKADKFWFVELIHPTLDLSTCEVVEFS